MKKKTILCVATLIVAAIISVTVVSCKKDKDGMVTKTTNSEAQALLNRIEAFQTLRDAVNSGAKADGSMTLEEMRKTLCVISNYEHSEHETYCLNTTLDTLRVVMPIVNQEGNVLEIDVVETYDAFEKALQKRMESIIDKMDVPSGFSIVLPNIEAKEEDSISIVFTRGEVTDPEPITSPLASGPFHDICLFWGLNLGRCDGGLGTPTDAAKELTRYFLFDYSTFPPGTFAIEDIEYVKYVATDLYGGQHPDWTYWEPSSYAPPCDTWLFWLNGAINPEPCLCEDELNCEYVGIKTNVALTSGEKYYSPMRHLPYFECRVEAHLLEKEDNPPYGRVHVACVKYEDYTFIPDQQ